MDGVDIIKEKCKRKKIRDILFRCKTISDVDEAIKELSKITEK